MFQRRERAVRNAIIADVRRDNAHNVVAEHCPQTINRRPAMRPYDEHAWRSSQDGIA